MFELAVGAELALPGITKREADTVVPGTGKSIHTRVPSSSAPFNVPFFSFSIFTGHFRQKFWRGAVGPIIRPCFADRIASPMSELAAAETLDLRVDTEPRDSHHG